MWLAAVLISPPKYTLRTRNDFIWGRFRGPDVLCKCVKFGQVFPLYLSSFVLTLMAVDRVAVTNADAGNGGGGGGQRKYSMKSILRERTL